MYRLLMNANISPMGSVCNGITNTSSEFNEVTYYVIVKILLAYSVALSRLIHTLLWIIS